MLANEIQFSIFWLKQIKEKYIHGGDEKFDSCRKRAIDIAIKELEKQNISCGDFRFYDAEPKGGMTSKEIASCILTVKLLRTLAHNIHGFMDIIDEQNCEKIIKLLESQKEKDGDGDAD